MAYSVIDLAQLCRAFFTLATVAGIGANAIPTLRQLVLYGPRIVPASDTAVPSTEAKSNNSTSLDKIARSQVPHTWFTHFYMVSVASSAFWAYQFATNGVIFRLLISASASNAPKGMTMNQILMTWLLMAFQGSRRLYESVRLLKPSTAKMPLPSYAFGMAFYLATGVAVWAEGMPALLSTSCPVDHIAISTPAVKTFIGILLFVIASGLQHDSHVYLAGLKKYTLPDRRLFRWILCPHYTSECAIYLALAIVAAPKGQVFNMTISTVLMFTIVNLSITAESTRAWYAQDFGAEKIQQRSRMLPYVY